MMHRFTSTFAVALLAALALPASASPPLADVTPAVAARLDGALQAVTGSTKGLSPALSVAVVENGRLVYVRAFGFSDLAAKTPATPDTRFRIASVTKMFTAVSVMQLVEAGRVRLDAPLATYLPDAPHAANVTIRQLLNHTSGIVNYGDDAIISGVVATPTTPRDIIASVAKRPLDQQPGAAFDYSNTGYVLLGLVVEAVTHRTLAEYEREHIFGPAHMTQTTVGEAAAGAPVARGYANATGTTPPPFSPSWFYADGDIVSTASDLARFDIALMAGRLVKPATFAEMQAGAVIAPKIAKGVSFGLGLMLFASGGETFVGHHGGLPGFAAETEMLPAHRYAMVVLSDASDFPTSAANVVVIRETLPALYAQLLAPAPATAPALSAAGEDPAVTAKLRSFVAQVQKGTVDRAALTDEMNAALTPASVSAVAGQFGPLGALQTLTFRSSEAAHGLTSFHYTAVFAGGQTMPLTIALDKDGKIAGFFIS
jgi:CubicO group peptidase (beta-lactamase class C family)